ncbi:MAG: enoyl-CoA hydratase/isomerase family protein [Acidimicrobiaceae bacterium]|nr:enoyl-CoA hydratase/isomerase family protein [Acidimicrobiaceae bacterium]
MTSSAGAEAQPLIVVGEDHRVGRIRFNRPAKLNPLSSAMLLELSAALRDFGRRDDIHSVVIEGTGRAFSAGFDLSGTNRPDTLGGWIVQVSDSFDAFRDILSSPIPTIAAVRGACVGGAFDLATCCDLIVCSDDAFFGYTEAAFGMGATSLVLPFTIGRARANEVLLTGGRISAERALSWGIVNAVVPGYELEEAVNRYTGRFANIPRPGLTHNRLHLQRIYELMGLDRVVAMGQDITTLRLANREGSTEFDELVRTHGLKEALRIFKERMPQVMD